MPANARASTLRLRADLYKQRRCVFGIPRLPELSRTLGAVKNRLQRIGRLVWRRAGLGPTITLVVPCYNVGRYLDDFARSIANQKGGTRDLRVIFVNDGSTDDTLQKIHNAINVLGPRTASVISKVNGGLCTARNVGLEAATGTWISFPDPDDLLDDNYLEVIRRELDVRPKAVFVATRLVRFYERTADKLDDHPLTFRFRRRASVRPANDLQDYLHLSSASAFYRIRDIRRHELTFDERIKPGFEDAHFTNRYLIRSAQGTEALFLRDAIYLYRKRADETSLQDGAKSRKDYWLDQSRYGWLGLLQDAKNQLGQVPKFIQRTVLYDVLGQIRLLLNSPSAPSGLSASEREEYDQILTDIMSLVEADVIETGTPGLFEEHKVALLNAFHPEHHRATNAYLMEWDPVADLVRVLIISPEAQDSTVALVDGRAEYKRSPKRIRHQVLGRDWSYEHIFWVRVGQQRQILDAAGTALELKMGRKAWGRTIDGQDIRDSLYRRAAGPDGAQLWLLMDRSDKADDNAEHLYRFLNSNRPRGVAIGFVLEKSSPDWSRLEAEGFNLMAFRGEEHRTALSKATVLASSHADEHILRPFADLATTYRFVFLQHGVTNQNQARWFNKIKPDLILTAAEAERQSLVSQDSLYRLTERHVALTGFPRHDALLRDQANAHRSIFIMPTWRRYLGVADVNTWTVRPEFYSSPYVAKWRELLNSPQLRQIAERSNLVIEFCPHPNFASYADAFSPPPDVRLVDAKRVPTLQGHLRACAVFVTDYSSLAFDAAFAGKPVVYYQFDRADFLGGKHLYSEGYFSYDRDGFGPVAFETDEAVAAIDAALTARIQEIYEARAKSFFAFHDQHNSRRATEALLALTHGESRRDSDEPCS